jgi:hypothetical protein
MNTNKSQTEQLTQVAVSKSVLLTEKCGEEFEKWFRQKRATSTFRFWMLVETEKNIVTTVIIEWFDSIGITVDIMPRMNDDKVVFEPNTFCLKHEITTEDFVQFDNRFDAKIKAIEKANEIYNEYFV